MFLIFHCHEQLHVFVYEKRNCSIHNSIFTKTIKDEVKKSLDLEIKEVNIRIKNINAKKENVVKE